MRRASSSSQIWLHRLTARCFAQLTMSHRLIPASFHFSVWPAKSIPLNAKCVSKRKQHQHQRSFAFCLIFTALVALFCVSMLAQLLILSGDKLGRDKLTIESLFDVRLSRNPSSIDWSEQQHFDSDGESLDTIDYRKRNEQFTVTHQWPDGFDYWQPVSTSRNKFYVFSAYVDSYNRSNLNLLNSYTPGDDDDTYFVRVIAATLLSTKEKVICCYDLVAAGSGNRSTSGERICREGSLRPIREHWNLKYSAFYLYCPLPRHFHAAESSFLGRASNVSLCIIATNEDNPSAFIRQNAQLLRLLVPSNRLTVHTIAGDHRQSLLRTATTTNQTSRGAIAVCVKPLHYHYNQSVHLLEFIELNRLLGVRRFYFYNHTIGREVDTVLWYLVHAEPSLVRILPWVLPLKSQKEIRTEGIFASLNDCLYRARKDRIDYVLFVDLDEIIVPQRHATLDALISTLTTGVYANQLGAFSFRNAFFYLQYPSDQLEQFENFTEKQKSLARQLTTLAKTSRKSALNMHKQRSKCIVVPEHVVEMGNHFVWELTSGKHTLNVNPTLAKLNHYRICEYGGDECARKNAPLIDRRVHRWAPQLISAVQQRLGALCGDDDGQWPNRSQMCRSL